MVETFSIFIDNFMIVIITLLESMKQIICNRNSCAVLDTFLMSTLVELLSFVETTR